MVSFLVYDALVSFGVRYDGSGVGVLADFGGSDLGLLLGYSASWFGCGRFGAVGR